MAPIDIIGSEEATQISSSSTWSRRDGEVDQQVFKGPTDAMNTLFTSLKNNPLYDTIEIRRGDGHAVLTVSIAEDVQTPALNDIWELLGREIVKDIRTHQDFNQSADQVAISDVDKAIRNNDLNFSPTAGTATTYFDLRKRGTSQYVRSQPILRRSVRTSDRGILDIAWDGVDRAWRLNNESGSPNPPAALIGDVGSMPEADATKKQWLKKAPQKRQVTPTLYEVVFEWHFARRWSEALYEGDSETDNP